MYGSAGCIDSQDGEKFPKKERAEGRSSIAISIAQAAIAIAVMSQPR